MTGPETIPVYLEVGKKRVFACALEWPGWCRSGKNEAQALEALAASAPRYAVVAAEAGVAFRFEVNAAFDVVERLPGNGTTDFGAPGAIASRDAEPLTQDEADRLASLVAASWRVLERVVAGAPAELRKGPRGGGRDRDAIVEHVLGAEAAYARTIGVRLSQPKRDDTDAVSTFHAALLTALRTPSEWKAGDKGWPKPYAARRIAWHVLDHIWEIEDRSTSAAGAD
jgi:hypothetical protein